MIPRHTGTGVPRLSIHTLLVTEAFMVTLVHIWRWHKYITYTLSHQGAYRSLHGDTCSHLKVTHIYYIYTVTPGCLHKPSWWHTYLHIHCSHVKVTHIYYIYTVTLGCLQNLHGDTRSHLKVTHIYYIYTVTPGCLHVKHTCITYTLSHQGAYLHGDTCSHVKVTHIYYIYIVTLGCLQKPSWWHSFTCEGDTHILHIHCHTRVLTETFMVTLVHMWRWHTYITYTLSH